MQSFEAYLVRLLSSYTISGPIYILVFVAKKKKSIIYISVIEMHFPHTWATDSI